MKKTGMLFFFFLLAQINFGQTGISVQNLNPTTAVQIIERALHENGYQIQQFDRERGLILTDWIVWNTLTISNRGRLQINVNNSSAYIEMVDRGYKSTEGWSMSFGDLSKKNSQRFYSDLAKRISEINASDQLTIQAVQNSRLILNFKPKILFHGLEFEFIDAYYTSDKRNGIYVAIQVTNISTYSQDLYFRSGSVGNLYDEGRGNLCGYISTNFKSPSISRDRITELIEPGQVEMIYSFIGCGHQFSVIPRLVLNIDINSVQYILENFNIKISQEQTSIN